MSAIWKIINDLDRITKGHDWAVGLVGILDSARYEMTTMEDDNRKLKAEVERLHEQLDRYRDMNWNGGPPHEIVYRGHKWTLTAEVARLREKPPLTIHADSITFAPKPVVWVREGLGTNDDGTRWVGEGCACFTANDVAYLRSRGIDVREWVPAVEPAVEWVYEVWDTGGRGVQFLPYKNGSAVHGIGNTVEEALSSLLKAEPLGDDWVRGSGDRPAFGVRRLTEGDEGYLKGFTACRDGRQIRGTNSDTPEDCIKAVLSMLTPATPATPAVTLADLPVEGGA